MACWVFLALLTGSLDLAARMNAGIGGTLIAERS